MSGKGPSGMFAEPGADLPALRKRVEELKEEKRRLDIQGSNTQEASEAKAVEIRAAQEALLKALGETHGVIVVRASEEDGRRAQELQAEMDALREELNPSTAATLSAQ